MADLFSDKPSKKRPKSDYSAQDIEVLEGLEPVRRRPGMYIGGTDKKALHHLVAEVFDNAMDEAVAGFATSIDLILLENGSVTVRDNGRGIPIDPHPKFPKKSALEVILTTLHSGGKFSNKVYYTSGGLHGVGISVVNALSDDLVVEVVREGIKWQQSYARGVPLKGLKKIGKVAEPNGTSVTFHPDPDIFGDNMGFSPAILYRLARSKAYLFKGVEIRWQCPVALLSGHSGIPETAVLHFPRGLEDYLEAELSGEVTVTPMPFVGEVEFEEGMGRVEWALHWSVEKDGMLLSYCNTVYTSQGGTHEAGLRNALLKGIRAFAELVGNKKASVITSEDVLSGVYGVLSLFIREPQFQGQTKEKLANMDATRRVENSIKDHFDHWLTGNKNEALRLVDFIISRAEERLQRRQQKETSRKSAIKKLRLPGKLADCSAEGTAGTEIFLVEGDSAGGSAKMARNRVSQAILPLRGKILNVASASAEKIRGNQEIADLALALGCGEKEQYNETMLRYEKVIIMTDADVDGAHIASLLMTYFFTYMLPLIRNGHLYLACPPLFKIKQGTETYYANSEEDKENMLRKLAQKKGNIEMTRFKGLGEMTPAQLKETAMDPKTRHLFKVICTEEEEGAAAEQVYALMGKKPELRFKFIKEQTALLGDALVQKIDV